MNGVVLRKNARSNARDLPGDVFRRDDIRGGVWCSNNARGRTYRAGDAELTVCKSVYLERPSTRHPYLRRVTGRADSPVIVQSTK